MINKINFRPDNLICSPKKGDKNFSCYNSEDLEKLRQSWNVRHKDDIISFNEPKEVWKSLKERLHNVCKKESCWLRQNFVSSNLGKELLTSFVPEKPKKWKKKPYEWLSTKDIQNVMKQYEDAYDDFEFIGPSPIDYDTHIYNNSCVWPELCNFNLEEKMLNGINNIGIIFNLDKHNEPGSHWVAVFISLTEKYIYYFDSNKVYKREIPKQIFNLIDHINYDSENNFNFTFNFDYNNKVEHQKQNTECGIYCIYFLTQLLTKQKKWKDFITERIADSEMKKLRNVFYNTNL
jgi:hypothetical protein